eukprot:c163_g1_i1.p1 GENE.c163_g1_i1~~c163_g1_i1.p1  ORF type:complete len:287 (+),score=67.44 c163_g1_i1:536-1396(+)
MCRHVMTYSVLCSCGHTFLWMAEDLIVPCNQLHLGIGDMKWWGRVCAQSTFFAKIKLFLFRICVICIALPLLVVLVLPAVPICCVLNFVKRIRNHRQRRLLPLKCVVVGAQSTGKSSFVVTAVTGQFPEQPLSTFIENSLTNAVINGRSITIAFWDGLRNENFSRLRVLSYPQTNVFLMCFAVNHRDSFERVTSEFVPEIRQRCPKVPILLVGLKSDLRESSGSNPEIPSDTNSFVTREEAIACSNKIKAVEYLECSALNKTGLQEIVLRSAVAGQRQVRSERLCC